MSMGVNECNYTVKKGTRPCKCGKGLITTFWHVTEESEYPPFEREYSEYFETTCPDNCEHIV